jgi:hypothetical protein
MKTIRIDPQRHVARSDPGVTLNEFDHELRSSGPNRRHQPQNLTGRSQPLAQRLCVCDSGFGLLTSISRRNIKGEALA